jgi:hypothetical protein
MSPVAARVIALGDAILPIFADRGITPIKVNKRFKLLLAI